MSVRHLPALTFVDFVLWNLRRRTESQAPKPRPFSFKPHRAEFIAKADEIKSKGVDAIYCIASNDAFVVRVGG